MTNTANLAPPGAGLPALERWISSAFLQTLRALLSKDALSRWLRRETEMALALAAKLPDALSAMHTMAHHRQLQRIVAQQTKRSAA